MSTIFRTELKLLLRHWGVWVVGAGAVIMAYGVGHDYTMSVVPFWIDESFFRFYLLAVMLLTVSATRRAASDRVDELIGAMPYRPAAWLLGRYFANCTVWLLISLVGWATAAATMLVRGEPANFATLTMHWVAAAPISVAVATAVGFALGHLPGYGILGYLLALGYFFGSVSVPMLTDPSQMGRPWLFLDMVAPQHWLPLTAYGYFPNGPLVLMNRLFDLGLAAAICAILLAIVAQRRRLPAVRAVVALFVAIAVSLTGIIGTDKALARRTAEVFEEPAVWVREDGTAPAPVVGVLRTDHYDLKVGFRPEQHALFVVGSFDVTNPSDTALRELEFTLRSNFAVGYVSNAANPSAGPLPFRRSNDQLVVGVPLEPGQTIRLTAQWGGPVWQWRDSGLMIYWGRALGAHVAPESIFLPATYGWYPLPLRAALTTAVGQRCDVTRCEPLMRDMPLPALPPASFKLDAEGTDLKLVSNAGAPAAGLYVIGTPFPTTVSDGVELTVAPENRAHALQALAELRKRADLLGVTVPDKVIEMPTTTSFGVRHATELAEAPGAVLLRSADLADLVHPSAAGNLASGRWWAEMPGDFDVGMGLVLYSERILTGRTQMVPSAVSRSVLDTMVALEDASGRDKALAVLREMYGAPTRAKFAAAVQAAAQGDGRVAKALAPLLSGGGQNR